MSAMANARVYTKAISKLYSVPIGSICANSDSKSPRFVGGVRSGVLALCCSEHRWWFECVVGVLAVIREIHFKWVVFVIYTVSQFVVLVGSSVLQYVAVICKIFCSFFSPPLSCFLWG